MALLEALACGRPVAAPAAAGPLEIVADGAGRLYSPGDAAAGAAAVRALLADPAAPAAARARARAVPGRGLRRPLRRRRGGGRAVSAFTIVVVLHDSGAELAALLPTLERHAARARS